MFRAPDKRTTTTLLLLLLLLLPPPPLRMPTPMRCENYEGLARMLHAMQGDEYAAQRRTSSWRLCTHPAIGRYRKINLTAMPIS